MTSVLHPIKHLSAAALAVFSAFALSGSPEADARGITVALANSFTTLDPYDATDVVSRQVSKSFYEGLFAFDKDMKPQPQLAESYEASPDGLVYTIKLKQGVPFHDGSEFDAEAVKVNFERVLDKKNGLTRYTYFNFVDKVEVVDKYTVRFTLKTPMSAFIARLANGTGQMICPSAIAKEGNDGLAFRPCGTGPYLLKSFNPSTKLEVVKNPNYRIKGLPKLDSITWLPVPENQTRVNMLLTGEADYVHSLPPELYKRLTDRNDIKLFNFPSIYQRWLTINMLHKPFDDIRVRQAIAYAINKKAYAKVVFDGFARPAASVLPPEIPGAVSFDEWPYDPKKARELLKEAGYPNGFETQLWGAFNNSTVNKGLQFLQQQLRQVGIKTTPRALEAGIMVDEVDSQTDPQKAPVRLWFVTWSNSTGEPDWGLRPFFDSRAVPPALNNTSYYVNPKVDALFDQGLGEVDAEKRAAIYSDIQKILWKDVPAVPLGFDNILAGVSKHLENFRPTLDSGFDFYNAEWKE